MVTIRRAASIKVSVKETDIIKLAQRLHKAMQVPQTLRDNTNDCISFLKDIGAQWAPTDREEFEIRDHEIALMDALGVKTDILKSAISLKSAHIQPSKPVPTKPNTVLARILAKKDPGPKPAEKVKKKTRTRQEIFKDIVGARFTRKEMVAYMVTTWVEEGGATGLEKIADTRISQYTGLLVCLELAHWAGETFVYDVK